MAPLIARQGGEVGGPCVVVVEVHVQRQGEGRGHMRANADTDLRHPLLFADSQFFRCFLDIVGQLG